MQNVKKMRCTLVDVEGDLSGRRFVAFDTGSRWNGFVDWVLPRTEWEKVKNLLFERGELMPAGELIGLEAGLFTFMGSEYIDLGGGGFVILSEIERCPHGFFDVDGRFDPRGECPACTDPDPDMMEVVPELESYRLHGFVNVHEVGDGTYGHRNSDGTRTSEANWGSREVAQNFADIINGMYKESKK